MVTTEGPGLSLEEPGEVTSALGLGFTQPLDSKCTVQFLSHISSSKAFLMPEASLLRLYKPRQRVSLIIVGLLWIPFPARLPYPPLHSSVLARILTHPHHQFLITLNICSNSSSGKVINDRPDLPSARILGGHFSKELPFILVIFHPLTPSLDSESPCFHVVFGVKPNLSTLLCDPSIVIPLIKSTSLSLTSIRITSSFTSYRSTPRTTKATMIQVQPAAPLGMGPPTSIFFLKLSKLISFSSPPCRPCSSLMCFCPVQALSCFWAFAHPHFSPWSTPSLRDYFPQSPPLPYSDSFSSLS